MVHIFCPLFTMSLNTVQKICIFIIIRNINVVKEFQILCSQSPDGTGITFPNYVIWWRVDWITMNVCTHILGQPIHSTYLDGSVPTKARYQVSWYNSWVRIVSRDCTLTSNLKQRKFSTKTIVSSFIKPISCRMQPISHAWNQPWCYRWSWNSMSKWMFIYVW